MLRRVRTLLAALVIVVALGLMGCQSLRGELPSEADRATQVGRIEATVLPIVKDLQVAYFMDERGCLNITYSRGDFIEGDPQSCGGSTSNPHRFDDVARSDHARIRSALKTSRTYIERIGGRFSSDGQVVSAWFISAHGAPFGTTWSLEYDPGRVRSAGPDGMVTVTRVQGTDTWLFVCCGD